MKKQTKKLAEIMRTNKALDDPIHHPAHYCQYKVEVIDLIEGMPYCRACAIKYLARAGYKPPADGQTQADKELEDLRKAAWMIEREIQRMIDS